MATVKVYVENNYFFLEVDGEIQEEIKSNVKILEKDDTGVYTVYFGNSPVAIKGNTLKRVSLAEFVDVNDAPFTDKQAFRSFYTSNTGFNSASGGSGAVDSVNGQTGVVVIPDEVTVNAGALSGAAPTGTKIGIDNSTGALYYVSGGNYTPVPTATIDLNFTVSDETGANGTGNTTPVSPPTATPDIGDVHKEFYDDVEIYFTAIATNWTAPALLEEAKPFITYPTVRLAFNGLFSLALSQQDGNGVRIYDHLQNDFSTNKAIIRVGSDNTTLLQVKNVISTLTSISITNQDGGSEGILTTDTDTVPKGLYEVQMSNNANMIIQRLAEEDTDQIPVYQPNIRLKTNQLVEMDVLSTKTLVKSINDINNTPVLGSNSISDYIYYGQEELGTWAASSFTIKGLKIKDNGLVYISLISGATGATTLEDDVTGGVFELFIEQTNSLLRKNGDVVLDGETVASLAPIFDKFYPAVGFPRDAITQTFLSEGQTITDWSDLTAEVSFVNPNLVYNGTPNIWIHGAVSSTASTSILSTVSDASATAQVAIGLNATATIPTNSTNNLVPTLGSTYAMTDTATGYRSYKNGTIVTQTAIIPVLNDTYQIRIEPKLTTADVVWYVNGTEIDRLVDELTATGQDDVVDIRDRVEVLENADVQGLASTQIDSSAGVITETLAASTGAGVVRLFTNVDVTNTATLAVQPGETLQGVIDGTFLFSSYDVGAQFRVDEVTGGWVVSVVGASSNTSGYNLVTAASTDIVGISGTTFLYDNTNPASGQVAINGSAYYDEGAYRYVKVDLVISTDPDCVYEIGANIMPAGGEIVSAHISGQALGQTGRYATVGVVPSQTNQFFTNRLDSIDNVDMAISVWLKVSNPAGEGAVILAGMVTLEDTRDLIFDGTSVSSGVSQNLMSLTWQQVVDDYESVTVSLRFGTTTYSNTFETSEIVEAGAIEAAFNTTTHYSVASINLADGNFTVNYSGGGTADVVRIYGNKAQKTVINTTDTPTNMTQVGTPHDAVNSNLEYVLQWDGTQVVNTLAKEFGSNANGSYEINHLTGNVTQRGTSTAGGAGVITFPIPFADTTYKITSTVITAGADTTNNSSFNTKIYNKGINGANVRITLNTATVDAGSGWSADWIAIGLKP